MLIKNPVENTLTAFTKISIEKNYCPIYFKGGGHIHLHGFFYEEMQKNPKIFNFNFLKERSYPFCEKIKEEFESLERARVLCTWGSNYDPFEILTPKRMLEIYSKIPERMKKFFDASGQRFFNQFACDSSGRIL